MIGGGGRADDQVQVVGGHPGLVAGCRCRARAQVGGVLALGAHVALLDAGARRDPLVGRVHHALEVGVGEHALGDLHAGAQDPHARGRGPARGGAGRGSGSDLSRAGRPWRLGGADPSVHALASRRRGSSLANSLRMWPFTFRSTEILAARTAFLTALADDRPWPITEVPLTPRSGAPPYSA